MPKATIEVEIPDGWEFDRYGKPSCGDMYFNTYCDRVVKCQGSWESQYGNAIIVRKVEPVTELAVRFKSGWIAMDGDQKWWWHDSKPRISSSRDDWYSTGSVCECFHCIMPAVTDWKQSLMRVG